ncbi:glycosyltransferase family 39 protein [Bacteroidota bacterium]
MKKFNISKEWIIIIGLALIKLLIHFLTNTNYELHRDAFLYYSLGEHLDWGFVSVPPLIGVFSKISTFLFGNIIFALRFFPALIGSVSVILIALIVKVLKGGKFAIIIAALAFICSGAFLRSNTLFQPVSFNQFFWLLSGYLIVKIINTHNPKIWLTIFIVCGLGFLNKYSVAFFIIGSLSAIAISKHRILYKSKYFFIGGIIGLLLILPNLLWQYNHNWPLIHHMNELYKYQFVNVSKIDFILGQFVMNLPSVIVWITGLIVFLFYKNEKNYRVIALIFMFTFLLLLFTGGKSYYTLGLYPILFALGGYAIDRYNRLAFKLITLSFMIIISWLMLPFSLPIYSLEKVAEISKKTAPFTNRWEDGKIHNLPQDYADMTGWKELSDMVINAYQNLPEESKNNCVIYAEEYCTAGAILFYGEEYGLPEPICFNDNFLLWAPDNINPDVFIYVNDEVGDIDWLFDNYELVGQINNEYFREDGEKIFVCTQPKDTFPKFYTEKTAELKRKFLN